MDFEKENHFDEKAFGAEFYVILIGLSLVKCFVPQVNLDLPQIHARLSQVV